MISRKIWKTMISRKIWKCWFHVIFFLQEVEGEEDSGEEEEESDEDDGEMTLSDLYKKNLDDDEDGEDFVEGEEGT